MADLCAAIVFRCLRRFVESPIYSALVELGMVVAIAKEVLVTTDAATGDFAAKFIVADHHYLLD